MALAFGLADRAGRGLLALGAARSALRRRLLARSGTVAQCPSPRHHRSAPFRSSPERSRFAPGLRRRAPWPCACEDGDHPLTEAGDGVWEGRGAGCCRATTTASCSTAPTPGPTRARAGSRRAFAARPAFSTPARFEIEPGPALALEELVLYELHVGTFSPEGTFDGVIPRLAGLRELGVTAIELMPVATFPGEPRLGLRRALFLRAASGLRRPGRARAARRRRAP